MFEPNKVIVFSRDELKQSLMLKKFPASNIHNFVFFLGDVRDAGRLRRAFRDVPCCSSATLKRAALESSN